MERVTAAELNSSGNEKFASQSSVVPFIFSRNKDRYAFDTRLTLETSLQAGVSIFCQGCPLHVLFSIYLSLFPPRGNGTNCKFSLASLSLSSDCSPGEEKEGYVCRKMGGKKEGNIDFSLAPRSQQALVGSGIYGT